MLQTLLFAPANHYRKVEKALSLPVDVVIIDLEDACAIDEKIGAREDVIRFLDQPRVGKAYVRVNAISTPFFFEDLRSIVSSNLDGIILPKVESPEEMTIAEWYLSSLEVQKDLPPESIDLIPIIETAKGLSNLKSILAHKNRVNRIAFGAGDFTHDTGMVWSKTGNELLYARNLIVIESRAADLEAPLDTVFVDLNDDEGLAQETKHAKELGFQGKFLIHPKQVEIVKQAFAPTDDEIKEAEEMVRAFEEAEKTGSAAIRVGNRFVDYPIVYRAQQLLAQVNRTAK